MAHQAGAYPGFLSMKRLGVFQLPLDGMLVHCRATPSSKFASTHLCTWVKRGTVRVKCLAQEHDINALSCPGLERRPFDFESNAITIRPRRPMVKNQRVGGIISTDRLIPCISTAFHITKQPLPPHFNPPPTSVVPPTNLPNESAGQNAQTPLRMHQL